MFGGGKAFSLFLDDVGSLWSWGSNSYGQLASFESIQQRTPTRSECNENLVSLGVGTGHCLAISSDGRVWGWGWNRFCQLGDSIVDQKVVEPVEITIPEEHGDIIGVAAGSYHSLVLDANGFIYQYGLIPGKPFSLESDPNKEIQLPQCFPDFLSIGAAETHSCALDKYGTLWTWGKNGHGFLGLGHLDPELLPVAVTGLPEPIIRFSCAGRNTIALDELGQVWIWGDNSHCQLSRDKNSLPFSSKPLRVEVPISVRAVTKGNRSCCLDRDGNVWIWGSNRSGALGVQTEEYQLVQPQIVPGLPTIVDINLGLNHNLAIDIQGKIWSWGANGSGELGLGHTNPTDTPQEIQIPFTPVIPSYKPAKSARK